VVFLSILIIVFSLACSSERGSSPLKGDKVSPGKTVTTILKDEDEGGGGEGAFRIKMKEDSKGGVKVTKEESGSVNKEEGAVGETSTPPSAVQETPPSIPSPSSTPPLSSPPPVQPMPLPQPTPPQPAPPQPVITPSGLSYLDMTVGMGPQPQAGQRVTVHYTGWLENGTKFDSSIERGQPFTFVIGQGQVIKGWDEGVMAMKVGGKRKLIIPPHLGYGAQGAGGVIPPNATLIFEVDLLGIQ